MTAGTTVNDDTYGGGNGVSLMIMSRGDDEGKFCLFGILNMGSVACGDGNEGVIIVLLGILRGGDKPGLAVLSDGLSISIILPF